MQRIDTALQPHGNLGGGGQGNFTGVVDFDLNDFDGVVDAADIEGFIDCLLP